MTKPLSQNRIVVAFVFAGLADLIQIPATLSMASFFGAPFAILLIFMMDCVLATALSLLLGFHWLLLPSFFLENIPGIGMIPAWTVCVALVIKQRKDEHASSLHYSPPAVHQITLALPEHALAAMKPPLPAPKEDVETRLNRLSDLLSKGIITQAEYESRRQQILAEI